MGYSLCGGNTANNNSFNVKKLVKTLMVTRNEILQFKAWKGKADAKNVFLSLPLPVAYLADCQYKKLCLL